MCRLCDEAKLASKVRELPNGNIGLEFEGFMLFEFDKSYFTNARDFRDYPGICEEILYLGALGWKEKYLKDENSNS